MRRLMGLSSPMWWRPHVVDEPGPADPGRHQQAGLPGDGAERDERRRVDDLGVVEPGQRLGGHDLGHAMAQLFALALASGQGGRPFTESPVQDGGGPALVGRQVGVAAGEGQPVVVPHGRAADHLHRPGQVGDHPAHDRQLLEVLLAEVGPARPGQVEQAGDDGGHAAGSGRGGCRPPGRPTGRPPRRRSPAGPRQGTSRPPAGRTRSTPRTPRPAPRRRPGPGGRRPGPRPARTAGG